MLNPGEDRNDPMRPVLSPNRVFGVINAIRQVFTSPRINWLPTPQIDENLAFGALQESAEFELLPAEQLLAMSSARTRITLKSVDQLERANTLRNLPLK